MLQVLLFSFLLLERDMLCTELLAVGADVEKYADEQRVEAELVLAGAVAAEAAAAAATAASAASVAIVAAAVAEQTAATFVLLMLPVAIAVTVEMAHRVAFSMEEAVWE